MCSSSRERCYSVSLLSFRLSVAVLFIRGKYVFRFPRKEFTLRFERNHIKKFREKCGKVFSFAGKEIHPISRECQFFVCCTLVSLLVNSREIRVSFPRELFTQFSRNDFVGISREIICLHFAGNARNGHFLSREML